MASDFADRTADELSKLESTTAGLARMVIEASRSAGWPVIILPLGGRRTQQDQRRLYSQGRTAPGPIVTHTLTSRHLSGQAFDLDLYGYPRSAALPLLRHLGAWWKSQGLRWGGDWGDYGHFEL